MWWLRAKLLHLYSALRSKRTEREIDEEINFHLDMRTKENLSAGLSPEAAEREARKRFGSLFRVKEVSRELRRGTVLYGLSQDLRHGFRTLVKNRSFTAVALLTLALGIGANAAIFSVINAVLLRPLPYRDPDRLVVVWEDATQIGFPHNTPAPANFADWKARNSVFEDMAAMSTTGFSLTGDGEPEQVVAQQVEANLFPLLGVEALIGRTFLPEEDVPGANKVAVVSYGLWKGRYGGDPNIVGRRLHLSGEDYEVVGVMPREFQFLESYIKLWVPIAFDPQELTQRRSHYLTVLARLKKGVTVQAADAEMRSIMERIAQQHPEAAEGLGATVVPLRQEVSGSVERALVVLLASVVFVLLIACVNLANLLLSRSATRQKEIAVRGALGAGRFRIVRQLMIESLILAGSGGVAGLLLAYWSLPFLRQLIPPAQILSTDLHLDAQVLGFTGLVAVVAATLFGLAPAWRISKLDLKQALHQGGGRSGVGAGRGRVRELLIALEMGLALVLLIGAGLLMQSFQHLRGQYSPLQAENVLTLRTQLSRDKYDYHGKRLAFYNDVLGRVRSIAGVVSAGYTTSVPLEWKGGTSSFVVEGRPAPTGMGNDANHRLVTPGYLEALGIPLKRGRSLVGSDNGDSQPVAVVNETMARQFWPNEDALGKRFKVGGPDSDRPWVVIVGIVADVRQMGVDVPVKAEMYFPYSQVKYYQWFSPRDLAIRTVGDPNRIVALVRRAVQEVDPNQPVSNIRTMDDIFAEETAGRRLGATLLSVFAGLALLLAAIGIHGVLSYFVSRSTAEIGVRLALGAQPRDIASLVVKRGIRPILGGTALGLLLAMALARTIESLLFGVGSGDPSTFGAVVLLLFGVALSSCLIPALKASKVDPLFAIRRE